MARRAKKQQSYISDLLRGEKSFGEKAARGLEIGLGLPPGWFDELTEKETKVAEAAPKYADLTLAERIAHRSKDMDEALQLQILNLIETINAATAERRKSPRRSVAHK